MSGNVKTVAQKNLYLQEFCKPWDKAGADPTRLAPRRTPIISLLHATSRKSALLTLSKAPYRNKMYLFRRQGRSVGAPNTDEIPAHRLGWASNRRLGSLGGAPPERRSLAYCKNWCSGAGAPTNSLR